MGLYWRGQMTSARFCCSSAYTNICILPLYGIGLGATSQWLQFRRSRDCPSCCQQRWLADITHVRHLLYGHGSIHSLICGGGKGRSLEETDDLFRAVDGNKRRAAVEHALHKGVAAQAENKDEEAAGQTKKDKV